MPNPQNFLQHKGSDLCWDLECPQCGESGHIDGSHNYFVRCRGCGQRYKVADRLEITPVDTTDGDCMMFGGSDG